MCEKQLLEKLHTSKDGISIVEVDERIEKYSEYVN